MGKYDFAALVGITRRHLIRLEQGECLPLRQLRDRIVQATGTDEQIEAHDDEEEEDALEATLLHAIRILRERREVVA